MKCLVVFSLLLGLISCQTYTETDKNGFDQEIKKYISKHKLQLEKTGSGLYLHIDTLGSGEYANLNSEIEFTYTGKFLDGQVFEHQVEPIKFHVKELIAGWKEALVQMRAGDKATLIAPPQLGYGDYKLEDIPENSILYYELTLVSIN